MASTYVTLNSADTAPRPLEQLGQPVVQSLLNRPVVGDTGDAGGRGLPVAGSDTVGQDGGVRGAGGSEGGGGAADGGGAAGDPPPAQIQPVGAGLDTLRDKKESVIKVAVKEQPILVNVS